MKHAKLLALGAAILGSTTLSAQAQEIKFIMCGGEVRAADQTAADAFEAENPGVTVNIEAVPWGTCQDKSLTLAAAGDPPAIAYMGSRTLKQLSTNDLIVPVNITAEQVLNDVGMTPDRVFLWLQKGLSWALPNILLGSIIIIPVWIIIYLFRPPRS